MQHRAGVRWSAGQRQRGIPVTSPKGALGPVYWPGAVRGGLEDDVDGAAAGDGGLEVVGDLLERVGGEADEQHALAGAGDELVQDGRGQPLLAGGAGSGPDRARAAARSAS